MHPYEDEQYLSEHPEIREKVGKLHSAVPNSARPPTSSQRRHSYHGEGSGGAASSSSNTAMEMEMKKKRGVFGKLKDKAIGTKEEREAEKKRRMEVCDSPFLFHIPMN